MGMLVPASLQEHCATLTDSRCPHAPQSRHLLMDILVMAVCAVIGGAEGWEDITEDGRSQAEWCASLLDVPHGLPGPDPFRRVVSRWDPEELPPCFIAWTQALREASGGDRVSIDGTTLRHAFEQATATAAIPRGRAWASATRWVVGPRQVDEKAKDILAMPTLLPLLDSTGVVVTMEAMGCQQAIATTMTAQEADEVLALTDHHPTLSEAVTRCLTAARATGCADIAPAYHATVDGEHGRIATRRYGLTSALAWRGATASWTNVPSVGRVASCRAIGATVQSATRYLLTSLPAHAVRCAHAVRQHWGVEHALPWVLEVSLQEEACRSRTEQGAPTFAVLRHIACKLLRRAPHHKRGIKARRKRAG